MSIFSVAGKLGKGILDAPPHFNLVMNVPGSIKGTPKNLLHMVESLPPGSTWTASGIGNSQVPMLAMAMLLGGHARTGMEDVLEYEKGVPATNRMLVERVPCSRCSAACANRSPTTTRARYAT